MRAFADLIAAATPPALPRPRFGLWLQVLRERRALARLDAAALADIGLDPAAADAEAQRPLWDVPHRR
ncbi:MAG: DUF1127 domain-containing protein [Pseudomonadota bacterium]